MRSLKVGRFVKWLTISFICISQIFCLYFVFRHKVTFWQADIGLVRFLYHGFSTGFRYTDDVPLQDIASAVEHQDTKMRLKVLFDKDEENEHSEVGGYITLTEDGSLNLYDFESEDECMYRRMMSCRTWRDIRAFMRANRVQLLEALEENGDLWMRNINDSFDSERLDDSAKQKIADIFKEMVAVKLDDAYGEPKSSIFLLFMLKSPGERLIGRFHLHLEPSGPSIADKECSQECPELLFESADDGYEAWIMVEAKAIESNTGIPHYRVGF